MREVIISPNQAGQRLDKFCLRELGRPPKVFVHKMLRKKKITLNGKKADGAAMLAVGDVVKFYIARDVAVKEYPAGHVDVIFEDENILVANKPAGLLTQPNEAGGDSLVGRIPGAVAINRLDRNTSGIVICAKNLPTAQSLSKMMHDRLIEKIYLGVAEGEIKDEMELKGFHSKNKTTNTAIIVGARIARPPAGDSKTVVTHIIPLKYADGVTCLKIYLHTGRSHQIRAHLQSIGHPLLGDVKYGGKHGRRQLLHAYQVTLPNGQSFTAPLPSDMADYFDMEV